MSILANNIRYLRKEKHNMSQDELAEKLGKKSYTTIQKWESGVSEPSIKDALLMADIFGVNINELSQRDLQKAYSEPSPVTSVRIPVIGRVAAGVPLLAREEIIDWVEIPTQMAKTGEYFGLRIKGNSMEPQIQNGDFVIVKKQDTAEDGQIVIVLIENYDECDGVCKRLKVYNDGIALISFNPAYDPMYFPSNRPVKIVGVVKELIRRF